MTGFLINMKEFLYNNVFCLALDYKRICYEYNVVINILTHYYINIIIEYLVYVINAVILLINVSKISISGSDRPASQFSARFNSFTLYN